jgi:hypothetical protein
MAGLDPAADDQLLQRLYTPGLRRAGDLRTAGALWAPARLMIHHASAAGLDFVQGAYAAAGAARKLRVVAGEASAEDIVKWVAPRKA